MWAPRLGQVISGGGEDEQRVWVLLHPSELRNFDVHELYYSRQVRETPELSTAALLGYWMGTDEGELLSEAAAKEVIDDEQHISEHLMAILNKLSRDRHITLLRKRAETLKSVAYTDLSNEQKRELVSLTTEIRKFSGRN